MESMFNREMSVRRQPTNRKQRRRTAKAAKRSHSHVALSDELRREIDLVLGFYRTPNEEDLALSEIYCPQCDHAFHRWQHLRSFSSESLSQIVREYGLDVVDIYATDFARGRMPNIWKSIKSIVKRLIGQKRRLPHLVCVARARHT